MPDPHQMLVLSPEAFNARTRLLIGLPIATADCALINQIGEIG